MPIDLAVLGRRADPSKTVLLFGAGSSIPSGGPSSKQLTETLASRFEIDLSQPLELCDLATIIGIKHSRRALVDVLSEILDPLHPTRGLLNLPDFDWAGLYTTNYDQLIERAFAQRRKELRVVASNFDFDQSGNMSQQCLFKLHGTIGRDISLGHQDRLVISTSDYDLADDYREVLYAKFTEQLYTNDAIVIGHSLSDPDLRSIVERATRIKRSKGAPGNIALFAYESDDNQALIYESRGLEVCFGGIDEFFAEMAKRLRNMELLPGFSDDPLERARDVFPSTSMVSVERAAASSNLARMFSGGAASYADIARGWTFHRDFSDQLETQLADNNGKRIAFILGAAGMGKTTGARKALIQLHNRGIECWEHDSDFALPAASWAQIDDELRKRKRTGVLLVDNAHENLHEVNLLAESICKDDCPALKIVLVSSKPHWNPRLKAPQIFSDGTYYELGALSDREIDSLLNTLDSAGDISALVEQTFLGFSRVERRRRLAERCRADMFVCMKNIFASESFDEIILREYAELNHDYQDLYKRVAGMESVGVRVHRQLVLRALSVQADQVGRIIKDLDGIVEERTISEREGVYAWRIRHGVIADIVTKYKYTDQQEYFDFLESTIENINPSYQIEISSINDICDPSRGIGKVHDKGRQNVLLRKLISLAPRQRVPRHRLITNLIRLGEYESASAEIRLFENELRIDGPVQRYKVILLIDRARHAEGLMNEDRAALVLEAANLAEAGIQRFRDDKNMYRVYLEVGVAYLRYRPDRSIFDSAIGRAEAAYDRILDPELSNVIQKFRRIEQRFTV